MYSKSKIAQRQKALFSDSESSCDEDARRPQTHQGDLKMLDEISFSAMNKGEQKEGGAAFNNMELKKQVEASCKWY